MNAYICFIYLYIVNIQLIIQIIYLEIVFILVYLF